MKLHYLEETSSTNTYSKENIEKLADKTVVYTKKQTSGRGRFDRKWIFVGEENLYMTIILKPSEEFREIYANFTQYACVILAKTLEKYGLNPKIKWPNDILVDGKKISGILAETVVSNGKFKGLVLGIGVNLNAEDKDLENIDKAVTSLRIETGNSVNTGDFLDEFLNTFFKGYDSFLKDGFLSIREEFLSRVDFLGKEITVANLNGSFTGIAKEIDLSGALILNNDGIEIELTSGDIA